MTIIKNKRIKLWFQKEQQIDNAVSGSDSSEMIPDGYNYLDEFLLGDVTFTSYRVAVDSAIYLTDLCKEMHREGRCAEWFSPEDIWIDTETGQIVWNNTHGTDNDTPILSMPFLKYYAPEIVSEKNDANIYSDRFLLGILIFQLLTGGQHPFEGRSSVCPVLTLKKRESLYVKEPRFVFGEQANHNQPVPKIHSHSIEVWNSMPVFMKKLFKDCFEEKGFTYPENRPSEQEWKTALIRYQNGLIPCICGNIMFHKGRKEYSCPMCGQLSRIEYQVDLQNISIPAVRGNRLYNCQGDPNTQERAKIAARIVALQGNVQKLGIQNLTDESWTAFTTKGQEKEIVPGGIIPLKEGVSFQFGPVKGTIMTYKGEVGEQ